MLPSRTATLNPAVGAHPNALNRTAPRQPAPSIRKKWKGHHTGMTITAAHSHLRIRRATRLESPVGEGARSVDNPTSGHGKSERLARAHQRSSDEPRDNL